MIEPVAQSDVAQQVGRVGESGLGGGPPAQRCFGRAIAPRLVRNTPERQAGLPDRSSFKLQSGPDRDERERIGETIANFQIAVI